MLDDLVQQTWQGLIAGVAQGRHMPAARAEAVLGGGPYTAAQARDAGLVDRLAYRDEVEARALARAGAGAAVVPMSEYLDAMRPEPSGEATTVAFVRAVGAIRRGSGELGGGVAADDLAQALTEAIDDPAVRAIVLRIASPGGSAVASETIAHQVRQAVRVGKPVIVTMGNVAASGGYWIAMDASRIVAEPLTLTGSIGVFAGKPVLAGISQKLGINWGRATAGPQLGMWSPIEPFTPAGKARLEALVGDLYASFKEGVARGRHLDPAAVEALAQGRVWTGSEALERKLVDRLGGLDAALAETRQALRLPSDAPLALVPFPPPETPLRLALQLLAQRLPLVESLITTLSGATLPATAMAPPIVIR
jgi:protease-4